MFQLYYTTLEKKAKQDLIDQIVIATERRPSTVASWCNGKRNPCPLEKLAIAEILGIDRSKLFPDSPVSFVSKRKLPKD
jgi:hypothetical protein